MAGESEIKRVGLEAFYEMALARDGIDDAPPLIAAWSQEEASLVEDRIRMAIVECGIIGQKLPAFDTTHDGFARTNQSKGNVAAESLANSLNHDRYRLIIETLNGAGYPDRRLFLPDVDFACCFEIKATSVWNERDSNRRVLTSSPSKLLRALKEGRLSIPLKHLIGTVLYHRVTGVVEGVRLDFLEPNSPVNVRLEASTSHQLLSGGLHRASVIR